MTIIMIMTYRKCFDIYFADFLDDDDDDDDERVRGDYQQINGNRCATD